MTTLDDVCGAVEHHVKRLNALTSPYELHCTQLQDECTLAQAKEYEPIAGSKGTRSWTGAPLARQTLNSVVLYRTKGIVRAVF